MLDSRVFKQLYCKESAILFKRTELLLCLTILRFKISKCGRQNEQKSAFELKIFFKDFTVFFILFKNILPLEI